MSKENYFWQQPGLTVIKGLDSRFLAITKEAMLLLFGHADKNNYSGLSDQDIKGNAANLYQFFIEEDKLVLAGKAIKTITISSWAGNTEGALFAVKRPYYENNVITGVMASATFIDDNFISCS